MSMTPADVVAALRLAAQHFDGSRGRWAYDVFDAINAAYFASELPTPWIRWVLTAHGRCLGLTRATDRPIISLHPSLLGGTEKAKPWGIDPRMLGATYAFDVLVHECTHMSQYHRLGGGRVTTSHNNTAWIAEVNRLSPLLGFVGINAGLSRTRRVNGKVRRTSDGNVPHARVAMFPYSLRPAEFYLDKTLPISCNAQL
jgi:hypothetical protein